MNPKAVAIVISPLKRLQITQAEVLERFLIKPLVINQDMELSESLLEIKVYCIAFQPNRLCRIFQHPRD